MLEPAKCTLCFNWLDPTASTARYPEALSIGMIPFVWRDYDKNNTYNIDPFQRVDSFEEFKKRVLTLRDGCGSLIKEYKDNYKKVLLTEDQYFEQFGNMMDSFLA